MRGEAQFGRRGAMGKMMRAGVVRAFGKPLSIEELPVPTPGSGEVLIKVAASGVCHTDLHAADGDWPVKPSLPFVPGHEGVGFIAACGPGVVGFKEGDRAGVAWLHDACGRCEFCMTGWDSLCHAQHNTGYSVNGSFAEYVIGAAPYVGRLPEKADFAEMAPILCAGVTTYKGIKETEASLGSGWPSQASAVSGNSPCNTQKQWACMSRHWTSPRTNSRLLVPPGRKSWSTPNLLMRPRKSSNKP